MQQNQPITSINPVLDYRFVCFRWCQYVNMIRVYISMFHVRLLNTMATLIMISGLSSPFNLFEQFCRIPLINSYVSCINSHLCGLCVILSIKYTQCQFLYWHMQANKKMNQKGHRKCDPDEQMQHAQREDLVEMTLDLIRISVEELSRTRRTKDFEASRIYTRISYCASQRLWKHIISTLWNSMTV